MIPHFQVVNDPTFKTKNRLFKPFFNACGFLGRADVFVNDPAKGYGVSIQDMLCSAGLDIEEQVA